ncbi:MAG: hypothetical protein ACK5KL_10755 [Dysgonomonas sp.]
MKHYRILLIIITGFLFFVACNKKKAQQNEPTNINDNKIEEVQKIGYSLFGGWIGPGYNLVIRPDSILYYYNVMSIREAGKYDAPITTEVWSDLIKDLDINDFEKIESTPTVQDADGSDREFFVETNKRRLSFINGESSEYYNKLKTFFDTVIKLEYECRKKSVKSKIE